MIRRPPRSTRVRSSAASDVYKRQARHASLFADILARMSRGCYEGATRKTASVEFKLYQSFALQFTRDAMVGLPRSIRELQQRRVIQSTHSARYHSDQTSTNINTLTPLAQLLDRTPRLRSPKCSRKRRKFGESRHVCVLKIVVLAHACPMPVKPGNHVPKCK